MPTERFGAEWIAEYTTAHEGVPDNPPEREAMDLHDNQVGREIALRYPGATDEAGCQEVITCSGCPDVDIRARSRERRHLALALPEHDGILDGLLAALIRHGTSRTSGNATWDGVAQNYSHGITPLGIPAHADAVRRSPAPGR